MNYPRNLVKISVPGGQLASFGSEIQKSPLDRGVEGERAAPGTPEDLRNPEGSNLLIVSSDPLFRRRLVQRLTRAPGIAQIHEAKSRAELKKFLWDTPPAVLLLDPRTKGLAMSEALKTIRTLSPTTNTILLSELADAPPAVEALREGAKGCCSRETDPQLLLKAIHLVRDGEIWVRRGVIRHLVGALSSQERELERQAHARLRRSRGSSAGESTGSAARRRKEGRELLRKLSPPSRETGLGALLTELLPDVRGREQAKELRRRLNGALEQEVKRIAHALHDEAGQLVASADLALGDLGRELPPAARERLWEVRGLLDEIGGQLRRLSHELHPTILDDLGLLPALECLADRVSKRPGLHIAVKGSTKGRLPAVIETALYRIVQEALTNVTKHAHATHVAVQIERDARRIRCLIRDDGIGFDVAGVSAWRGKQGLGLLGMRERLNALAGTLQISSAPGQATELVVTIPLEP